MSYTAILFISSNLFIHYLLCVHKFGIRIIYIIRPTGKIGVLRTPSFFIETAGSLYILIIIEIRISVLPVYFMINDMLKLIFSKENQ